MSIRKVSLRHLALPLRMRVKHASHNRTLSDSLVVRVELDGGEVGHGEGVPRSYVTGETIETAFEALGHFDAGRVMGNPSTFEQAVERIAGFTLPEIENDPRGMFGNAARCALELALLDAYGKRFGRSVGDAIRLAAGPDVPLSARPTVVRYSGAITARSRFREMYSAAKMWGYGFRQIKVKVGVPGQDDPLRMRGLRRIVGRGMDLRIDANEAWCPGDCLSRIAELRAARPSVIEQPVAHRDVESLSELRPKLGVPVMLDESLCGYPDAVRAVERKTADYFNVRVSKCGGIFPSLRIIGLAARSGIGLQLGCHPGETGLLSAAGRFLAGQVRGLSYVEGSYDRHILDKNIIVEDLTFGYGGLAPPLTGPGLGVTVDSAALEELTARSQEISND